MKKEVVTLFGSNPVSIFAWYIKVHYPKLNLIKIVFEISDILNVEVNEVETFYKVEIAIAKKDSKELLKYISFSDSGFDKFLPLIKNELDML